MTLSASEWKRAQRPPTGYGHPRFIVTHAYLGVDCCGCLFPVEYGNRADIVCNECETIVLTVPASDVRRILEQIAAESETEITSHACSRCGDSALRTLESLAAAYHSRTRCVGRARDSFIEYGAPRLSTRF